MGGLCSVGKIFPECGNSKASGRFRQGEGGAENGVMMCPPHNGCLQGPFRAMPDCRGGGHRAPRRVCLLTAPQGRLRILSTHRGVSHCGFSEVRTSLKEKNRDWED